MDSSRAAPSTVWRPVFLATCLLGLVPPTVGALEPFENLGHLGVAEGLSQSWVYTILQDDRGFLWFGTDNGLDRWDGHHMVHFKHRSRERGSLADSKVYSLLEDRGGHLWVGTVEGGLHRFDPAKGTFERFPVDPESPRGVSDSFVSTLLEDRAGRIWVGTFSGLDVRDPTTGTFRHLRHDPEDPATISDDRIRAIYEDREGRIWVGSEGGLDELDPATARATRHRYTPEPPVPGQNGTVKAIREAANGDLWVGTRDGLYRYRPGTATISVLRHEPGDPGSLADDHVWDLLEIDETLWIATHEAGLARLHLATGKIDTFRHDPLNPGSLAHDSVKALYRDRGGLLWIGTVGGGLSIWNPRTEAIVAYRPSLRTGQEPQRGDVRTILGDAAGGEEALWIGTGAGLERFDRETGEERFLDLPPGIRVLARHPSGYVLAADESEIYQVDPRQLEARPWSSEGATSLLADDRGRIWAGDGSGLRRHDLTGAVVARYHHDPDDPRSLPNDEVLSLAQDSAGAVWVGTRDGVGRWDEDADAFDVHAALHLTSGHDGVVSIFPASPELLWLATENGGLLRLRPGPGGDELRRFTTEDGLLSDNLAAVTGDPSGHVWVSSVEGLTRLDPETGNTRIYTAEDGLHGSEFHPGAVFRSRAGELFFGGPRGLTALDPSRLGDNEAPPPVAITAVTRGTTRTPIWGPPAEAMRIDSNDRVLAIEFAALDYGRPDRNRFRYRLRGAEDRWLDAGTSHEVTYSGLAPGRYLFEVLGANDDGVWSERPATLPIVVVPPPWRTGWAYGAYGLSAILLVGLVTRARRRKLTERRRHQDEIRLLAKAFESASEGMVITDARGIILETNRGFTTIFGYEEEEIVGQPSTLLNSARHSDPFYEALWRRLRENGQWQGEIWQRRKNDEEFPTQLRLSALFGEDGAISHYVAVLSDVTEQKRAEEELRRLASFDLLTNLPNRTLFEDRLEHALAGARRDAEKLALLFIDLDRFKQVNDSLGHGVGDGLLQEVAMRLRECVRTSDTVARLGGDEFTVILEGVEDLEAVHAVAQKILTTLSRPYVVEGLEINVTASIGICMHPEGGSDGPELMRHADTAMYQAKGEGRNTYLFYTEEMDAQVVRRMQVETELRRALEREELLLHFQPRVSLSTGAVRSVEALVRWNHPSRGLLLPDDFIGIAEESGLILPLDEWVLERACRQAVEWLSRGLDVRVAVNLSARQFRREELAVTVSRVLDRLGLDGRRLELEITETTIMANLAMARRTLRELKELGVYLSVDDFGTGYSSLSYLKIFPLDALKIDRSFVREVGRDPQDEAIVTAIATLARSLDLAVTGEGVETVEQLAFLREAGCDEIQGFLVGAPCPATELAEILERGRVLLDGALEQGNLESATRSDPDI